MNDDPDPPPLDRRFPDPLDRAAYTATDPPLWVLITGVAVFALVCVVLVVTA